LQRRDYEENRKYFKASDIISYANDCSKKFTGNVGNPPVYHLLHASESSPPALSLAF